MAGVGTTTQSPLVTSTTTTPAQSGTGQSLGATAFLSLLTTELQNQDPLNPMDSTQSVTQLAQFQALQSQVTLADSFQSFQNNFSISQAASLIGLTVAVNTTDGSGNTSTQTGIVSGIQIVNGTPEFALTSLSTGQVITGSDGSPALYQMNQITAVVPTGSSSTSSGG
ncbi:MAG: flagellar hook capping FlgD N-terminal domain-containing protein [Vulcanimicrobiaceae bacterium]|jgi:flagellar basal-body rod modification protein FlgD